MTRALRQGKTIEEIARVTVVVDLLSRRVVGWYMNTAMTRTSSLMLW